MASCQETDLLFPRPYHLSTFPCLKPIDASTVPTGLARLRCRRRLHSLCSATQTSPIRAADRSIRVPWRPRDCALLVIYERTIGGKRSHNYNNDIKSDHTFLKALCISCTLPYQPSGLHCPTPKPLRHCYRFPFHLRRLFLFPPRECTFRWQNAEMSDH